MELIRGLHNVRSRHQGCVLTIGNFDGVHLGHQQLLQEVTRRASERQLKAGAMFFEPQPREFFAQGERPSRLTRFRDKTCRLAEYKLDWLLCVPFNQKLRQLSAQQFVQQILIEQLQVGHLVIGDDFRFGCDRQGDFEFLINSGEQFGFTVQDSQTIQKDAQRVSSTRIRELLEQDDIGGASQLLGWPYSISGRVVHGAKLGRQIGVPTANLALAGMPSPLTGVFCVSVCWESGKGQMKVNGVANLGQKPTVNGLQPSLEVHLLDFDQDLYGQHLEVQFLQKLRPVQKFADLEQLKQQIHLDIAQARAYFND
jgi:riboflavin kinase/FMN adenylyltransferase